MTDVGEVGAVLLARRADVAAAPRDTAGVGDEQKRDRRVGVLDDQVGVEQQGDVARAGALGQDGLHDRAQHVGRLDRFDLLDKPAKPRLQR